MVKVDIRVNPQLAAYVAPSLAKHVVLSGVAPPRVVYPHTKEVVSLFDLPVDRLNDALLILQLWIGLRHALKHFALNPHEASRQEFSLNYGKWRVAAENLSD